jgi:hypothetical protein
MRRIIHTALGGLAAVLVMTGTATAKSTSDAHAGQAFPRLSTTDGAPMELEAVPGSLADQLARQLMAREIERAKASGPEPVVLVAMARLDDKDEMLFVQLQSPGECGSAGCSTVSFKNVNGRWIRTLDTTGGSLRISTNHHRGMPDLFVDRNHMVWGGTSYEERG